MTENQILDLIAGEFATAGLSLPDGFALARCQSFISRGTGALGASQPYLSSALPSQAAVVWRRVARRLASISEMTELRHRWERA